MKKLHWTLLGMVSLASAFAAYYGFATGVPQGGVRAQQHGVSSTPSVETPGGGKPLPHAAAEYRANLALAASKLDEQNPLRSYQPTPGIPGRIALEEMRAKGIPATALSATLALGLSRNGRLSDEEKIVMPSILFALYNRENTTGANQEIAPGPSTYGQNDFRRALRRPPATLIATARINRPTARCRSWIGL